MKKCLNLPLLLASGLAASFAMLSVGCSSNSVASAPALWKADTSKDKIVVISDVHLGIRDDYTEDLANRPLLVNFLKQLQATKDVRELVIAGDFLDEWYLPFNYPSITDETSFYKGVIANNREVINELNKVADSGIKLVYVVGNHDMTLSTGVLQDAMPRIVQPRDSVGLGVYYTGDRNEIAIEHGHRYDPFSAPDTVTNAAICENANTIFPAGYFYARYAASWVLEGRPAVTKNLPVVTTVPDRTNTDQFGAYLYYRTLAGISARITPKEDPSAPVFDMHTSGFNGKFTYLDFYPAQQSDGRISAPVLFKDIQRTWQQRQTINQVAVPNTFIEALGGAQDWSYYYTQAKTQYLQNPDRNVDVVVFGHTHVPQYRALGNGKVYVNDGTWIDHNTDSPAATRTFAVITTGSQDTSAVFMYQPDGTIADITASISQNPAPAGSAK
jgi:UDP-2,3-diacylglucosamine pyrophosphatase LpxH